MNTKSINKILNFLEREKRPVSKTEIVKSGITYGAVSEGIELLERFGKVIIVTNGKTSLIQLMEASNDI